MFTESLDLMHKQLGCVFLGICGNAELTFWKRVFTQSFLLEFSLSLLKLEYLMFSATEQILQHEIVIHQLLNYGKVLLFCIW